MIKKEIEWFGVHEKTPPDETPILTNYDGGRILERRWETSSWEEGRNAFWYWDDPNDDGQDIHPNEVTMWAELDVPDHIEPLEENDEMASDSFEIIEINYP